MKTMKSLFAAIMLLAGVAFMGPISAEADGLPSSTKDASGEPRSIWTGPSVTGFASHDIGDVKFGGPIGLSSTGVGAGGDVNYNYQIGQNVVVGIFAGGQFYFGDLKDLGINRSYEVGGRIGALVAKNVLVYGFGGWTRVDTRFGNFTGWEYGPGLEAKMDAKWSIDGRYVIKDLDVKIPGIDAEMRSFRLGLTYQLN